MFLFWPSTPQENNLFAKSSSFYLPWCFHVSANCVVECVPVHVVTHATEEHIWNQVTLDVDYDSPVY